MPVRAVVHGNHLSCEVIVLFGDVVVGCGDVVGDFKTAAYEKVAVGLGDTGEAVVFHDAVSIAVIGEIPLFISVYFVDACETVFGVVVVDVGCAELGVAVI